MEQQTQPAPEPRIEHDDAPEARDERRERSGDKPLRASPFSWETASRVRAPWRR